MSYIVAEVPVVIVKPGKMINYWSSKLKIAALLLALLLYIYFVLFLKTLYMKNKRLDRIMTMTLETEKLMRNVRNMDEKMAVEISALNKYYDNY